MNITIVAPYCSLPSEPHFNRFWYLAELLSQSHDVLLITSNFKHYDKSFRRPEDAEAASQGRLKVMLLEESGYSKNVSLGRVTSHHRFVKHFEKWLENCRPGEQDVVFSAYPLIATNLLLGKHKARLGYKLIVDVQDVWPESFSSVIPFLKKSTAQPTALCFTRQPSLPLRRRTGCRIADLSQPRQRSQSERTWRSRFISARIFPNSMPRLPKILATTNPLFLLGHAQLQL